jgi:hypothetical protein
MKIRERPVKELAAIGLILLALLQNSPANANVSVREFREARKAGGTRLEQLRLYVIGLANGMANANAELTLKHQRPLFCAPEKFGISAEDDFRMIEDTLAHSKTTISDTQNIESVLMLAYELTFPCAAI